MTTTASPRFFPEDDDSGEGLAPLEEWDIEVFERGLFVDLGEVGGREQFVTNVRRRVTEEDGARWTTDGPAPGPLR